MLFMKLKPSLNVQPDSIRTRQLHNNNSNNNNNNNNNNNKANAIS